jgi:ribonuclease HI
METIAIYVDGAVSGTVYAGTVAVARTREGLFLGWLSRQMPQMTNNEAEYHAALLGLKLAHLLNANTVEIVSDSEVIVRQMQGQSRVLSNRLKRLHQETCKRTSYFQAVTFRHVLRDQNCLADALATESLSGRIVQMKSTPTNWLPLGRS